MADSKKSVKDPFIRVVKRDGLKTSTSVSVRAVAVVLALLADALFIYFMTGLNPVAVYAKMLEGTFDFRYGSEYFISVLLTTLRDMALLLGIAVALAPAFKMKFWNIGAEGQVLMGALATAFVMIQFTGKVPNWLLVVMMVAFAIFSGAVWGLIPAIFKTKRGTNETLFTLMMNYIAINIVDYQINIWRGNKSALGNINSQSQIGWLPRIMGDYFTLGIMLVLVLAVVIYIYLKYTKQGYEISVVGESERTARYAGINVKNVVMRTMAISGAICGICGFLVVAGKDHTVSSNSAGGYGFTAIIVAWMAKFNPFFMMLIAFLIAFLEHGASAISSAYPHINSDAADIISGIILFFLIGCEFFINYRPVIRIGKRKED